MFKFYLAETCQDGYNGDLCDKRCKFPSYGSECRLICQCLELHCNFVSGCKNITHNVRNRLVSCFLHYLQNIWDFLTWFIFFQIKASTSVTSTSTPRLSPIFSTTLDDNKETYTTSWFFSPIFSSTFNVNTGIHITYSGLNLRSSMVSLSVYGDRSDLYFL